jgi:predicted AlkP superfamily phosphohydrolase/phosphomutase
VRRRDFLGGLATLAGASMARPAAAANAVRRRRVLILGIDGLDPGLLQRYLDARLLPNFQRLIDRGDFKPLQTTMPPLSPVAWSTFITGLDPGGHGISDFVHRDPATLSLASSLSRAVNPARELALGSWVIPLSEGRYEQLRRGRAFWQVLEDAGIPTTVFRIPANFPPVISRGRALSGMGTPDILGTPGTFSFFTDRPVANEDAISGGKVYRVRVVSNRVAAQLVGPPNPLRRAPPRVPKGGGAYVHPPMLLPFRVRLDPTDASALFEVQDHRFVLRQGEWSDWVPLEFSSLAPIIRVRAIARFYLQEVRPAFRLYVSPLQIDPEKPAMPISTPAGWSRDLYEALGYFYTQELPEETKAFSAGLFSGHEFWEQAQYVYREQRRALGHLLAGYRDGLLFVYFSSVDQACHMLWRYTDERHPAFVRDPMLGRAIQTLYQEMDEAVGAALAVVDDQTTLIVMSDHGFAGFYRTVNLNAWLQDRGYIAARHGRRGGGPLFAGVDWTRTTAYAVGLNGVYVNLRGRERDGIVAEGAAYRATVDRLEHDLLAMRDVGSSRPVVTLVVQPRRDFRGPERDRGPDLIVGYNTGYRTSWDSPLGTFGPEIFEDNRAPWSGDHAMDHRLVPGVLVTNGKITADQPSLADLTVAVLEQFGVEKLPAMRGRGCLAAPPSS